MIPVQLKLENFLSYGENTDPLDFELFQVACLSGGNGQGKSALLDAITWAIWGEARKGSGSRKPDDDLLRIGTQAMKVEFIFDLEGQRYRVIRGYRRSASGKTSKPILEFQIFDEAEALFNPLTTGTVVETQAQIIHVLGIDYDTFINSAFLLQGRSDEFTRKKASERKEILTRILALNKYEKLETMAREEERKARDDLELADREIERLDAVLVQEPEILAEKADLEGTLAEQEQTIAGLAAAAAGLTERLSGYAHTVERAASLEKELESLRRRRQQVEAAEGRLTEKLERARQLIARARQIRAAHATVQGLNKERDVLDDRRAQHDGMSHQIQRAESNLKEKRFKLEKHLDRLRSDQRGDQTRLADDQVRLTEKESIQQRLDRARSAKQVYDQLQARAQELHRLRTRETELEKTLAAAASALTARITEIDKQIEEQAADIPRPEQLLQETQRLRSRLDRLAQVEKAREQVVDQGRKLKGDIEQRTAQVNDWSREAETLAQSIRTAREASIGTCPTCGQPLTNEKRRTLVQAFESQGVDLRCSIEQAEVQTRKDEAERLALRDSYKTLSAQLEEAGTLRDQLAAVQHRLSTLDERREKLRIQKELRASLQVQLQTNGYEPTVRNELAGVRDDLSALDFDESAYERAGQEASQYSLLASRLQELDGLGEACKQLKVRIDRRASDIEQAQQDLEQELTVLQQDVNALLQKRDAIGFDGQRLEAIKQQLRTLDPLVQQMPALEHAEENQTHWEKELKGLGEERALAQGQEQERRQALDQLREALEGRADVERELREVTARKTEQEEALKQGRVQFGQLQERLRRCADCRRAKTEQKNVRKQARARADLYRHLRTAFGKNGIPSLIIEQSLPDIEDRANELLYRLTDGRTRVRLETLKDRKSGSGTIETLDIRITDEMGVARAYETFSGGEAFRVNFALRIALSQLLAERSGVRIRTLVIDEGFGTQDEQGVQNLVQAINAIREDFDKIIVITHLNELKNAFPVRIEVQKHPVDGSSFEMVGLE